MASDRDHFDEFQDHTVLKHLILDKYLNAWARKLLQWGGAGEEVWFVDAFAGEGSDQQGKPGSPVIAAEVAKAILRSRGQTSNGNPPMRILATEVNKGRCGRLEQRLKDYIATKLVEVRCAQLHDILQKFADYTKDAPILYFLDPFGVAGLIADDLPTLFRGSRNEVFALFSDVGAHRLHATLLTPDRDVNYEVERVLQNPSLFPELTAKEAEEARIKAEKSNRALKTTRAASERILSEAIGPEAFEELSSVAPDERRQRATELYMKKLQQSGARYVLSLPVRNATNQRVYQLVHASQSKQGFRAMKEAMQTALNASALPDEARQTMTVDISVPIAPTVEQLRDEFRGQTLRWTIEKDRGPEPSIKRFLLEETPVFPNQFQEVKGALVTAGLQLSAKPLTFEFPA